MAATGEKAEVDAGGTEATGEGFADTAEAFGTSDTPPDPSVGVFVEELTLLCAAEPAGDASTLPRAPATEALWVGAEEVEEAEEEEDSAAATASAGGTEEEAKLVGNGALDSLFILQGFTVGAAREGAWAGG